MTENDQTKRFKAAIPQRDRRYWFVQNYGSERDYKKMGQSKG